MTVKNIRRILYITNELADKQQLEQLFKSYTSVSFISTNTAEDGIVMAEQNQPDVIFIDTQLPKMNGYSAVKILRRNASFQATRIVALSHGSILEYTEKAREAGFNELIKLPIEKSYIMHLINKL